MKKIVSITLLVAILSFVFTTRSLAQGNLQFNQVKYMQFSVTQVGTSSYTDATVNITVPANKVWKIETLTSSTYISSNNLLTFSNGGRIAIDNRLLFDANSNVQVMPHWLPPGTYTLSIRSTTLTNGTPFYGSLSAIEFNVVP